ncbi:MAG: PQQ-dependent sugar dehydrogenase [Pseudomonadota bacterium]
MPNISLKLALALTTIIAASSAHSQTTSFDVQGSQGTTIKAVAYAEFDEPWAMTFLPDGRMLITEKSGQVVLVSATGERLGLIEGVPETDASGQGGLGDIVLHPDFRQNGLAYLSYVEFEGSESGAVVERAPLTLTEDGGTFGPFERIWTQIPKGSTTRHYSHRMAFDKDGYLFITSGDRGEQTPAQDLDVNLGKIIRLRANGDVPSDNPYVGQTTISQEFWSVGHRNPLGLAFDANGNLWSHEMGPRHGDELNLVQPGQNYGWPVVSDGNNYSGALIPDHDTSDEFSRPAISWVPAISPAGLIIYSGDVFPDWSGNAFIGGMSSEALIRVEISADGTASEQERFSWEQRIREVEQGPDGHIWVLEDGSGGRLIRLES